MKELFDPTRVVEQVANYIAYPHHPHDEVCFYGLPFAHDREHTQRLRRSFAEATKKFYRMNHFGLRSNCSSFAEYLRSRAVVDIVRMPNLLSYFGDLFPYNGQHLNFGDVLAVQYLRDEALINEFFPSEIRGQIFDIAERRREDSRSSCFLRAYARGLGRDASRKSMSRAEFLRMSESVFIHDYHFLTCVGYEIDQSTGNLEPVFVGQNGKNIPTSKKDRKILLPPFGPLELCFLSKHVAPEEHTPALVLCSKPF